MTKDSKAYRSGEYADFFEASATHSLSAEEAVAYSQSYYKELENQSAVRFAVRRTREEALEEGRAEGLLLAAERLMAKGMNSKEIEDTLGIKLD